MFGKVPKKEMKGGTKVRLQVPTVEKVNETLKAGFKTN